MCDLLDSSFRFVVLLVFVVLVGPVGCVNPWGFCDSSDCTICVASPPLEIVQCLREIDSCLDKSCWYHTYQFRVSRKLVSSSFHPVVCRGACLRSMIVVGLLP